MQKKVTPHRENGHGKLRALLPFAIGRTELLLVPNQIDDDGPRILLTVRNRDVMIAEQLTTAEARRFSAYLNFVTDEAEALARFMSSGKGRIR